MADTIAGGAYLRNGVLVNAQGEALTGSAKKQAEQALQDQADARSQVQALAAVSAADAPLVQALKAVLAPLPSAPAPNPVATP